MINSRLGGRVNMDPSWQRLVCGDGLLIPNIFHNGLSHVWPWTRPWIISSSLQWDSLFATLRHYRLNPWWGAEEVKSSTLLIRSELLREPRLLTSFFRRRTRALKQKRCPFFWLAFHQSWRSFLFFISCTSQRSRLGPPSSPAAAVLCEWRTRGSETFVMAPGDSMQVVDWNSW